MAPLTNQWCNIYLLIRHIEENTERLFILVVSLRILDDNSGCDVGRTLSVDVVKRYGTLNEREDGWLQNKDYLEAGLV